jgi:hypothetical protein
MISATELRRRIAADPRYSHLAGRPIDYAIAEIRRLRKHDAEYWRLVNRQHEGEDEAYERMRVNGVEE